MSGRLVAMGCAAALVVVSACTSGKTTSGEGTPATPVGVTSPQPDPSTTTAADSSSAVPSTTPASKAPTSSAPATTAPSRSFNTCAFTQLGIRALRGSGAQQREYAAVLFTNKGAKACTIYGFPGVSLRYQNALLGQPATRAPVTPAIMQLAPGGMVQANITDYSSCQAPLSDTVRVYPPDSTQFVDLPLQLRGCALTVQPVAAS